MRSLVQTTLTKSFTSRGQFRAMKTCDINGCAATIEWTENFVTFMDNLFQLQLVSYDTRLLYVPIHLNKLTILPILHHKLVKSLKNQSDTIVIPAYYNPNSEIIR